MIFTPARDFRCENARCIHNTVPVCGTLYDGTVDCRDCYIRISRVKVLRAPNGSIRPSGGRGVASLPGCTYRISCVGGREHTVARNEHQQTEVGLDAFYRCLSLWRERVRDLGENRGHLETNPHQRIVSTDTIPIAMQTKQNLQSKRTNEYMS